MFEVLRCLHTGAFGYRACMLDLRTLIRPLLAAPFIVGGVNTLRDPQPAAKSAADVVVPIGKSMGLGSNPESLVKLNAGVQIGGGDPPGVGIRA